MATVSRVVNGNQNVKPETRNKVNEVIKKLNYRPNAVARGLASKRTTTVGVIIQIFQMFIIHNSREVLRILQQCINITQSSPILIMTLKKKEIFNNLLSKQVDGIIFLGGTISEEIKDLINQSSVQLWYQEQMVKMIILHQLILISNKLLKKPLNI